MERATLQGAGELRIDFGSSALNALLPIDRLPVFGGGSLSESPLRRQGIQTFIQ
jgi:hypothetical protein